MENYIIVFGRILMFAVLTGTLAAGTWMRNLWESLLLLLPARPPARPSHWARRGTRLSVGRTEAPVVTE